MKKIFLTAAIIVAATVAFAHHSIDRNNHNEPKTEKREAKNELRRKQRKKISDVISGFTKMQFANDFPGATNIEFVKTNHFDEVNFMSGKKMLRAYYDHNSNLLGTVEKKTFADLPENAQKKILAKYANFTIGDVIKFDDNQSNDTDMILYGTSFNDEDNYFVELENTDKAIMVRVDLAGFVSFFRNIK